MKVYDRPNRFIDKGAFTVTVDAGCEFGGGVSCSGAKDAPAQYFLGFMAYNRWWFHKDLFGVTVGGGAINNPGRYFTANPGDPYKAWDASGTFDYMPKQYLTWRFEYNHRAANVPYFSGSQGIRPNGGNSGPQGSYVQGFSPDLRKRENRFTIALLLKL